MPLKKPQLVNGEIYHIVLRAVGNTVIFNDENDYYRGIFSLYEFNNAASVEIRKRREERKKEKASGSSTSVVRDMFVEIFALAFMPNHMHLLVRQIKDNGITQFMRKVGTGYANYFNKKYDRKGHLFGGFRSVHISTNEQLQNVFVYIHTNAASLIDPGYKNTGIENPKKVLEFLENYKWHSYPDYLGKKNFQSVTERSFLLEAMDGEAGCKKVVEGWINFKGKNKIFGDVVLE